MSLSLSLSFCSQFSIFPVTNIESMSLALLFHPIISFPKTHLKLSNSIPTRPISSPQSKVLSIKSLQRAHEQPPPKKPRWENLLSTAASLCPVYVTAGSVLPCAKPSAFLWFVSRGPTAYTLYLAFVMLVMGLTLELRDLFRLLMERPLSIRDL